MRPMRFSYKSVTVRVSFLFIAVLFIALVNQNSSLPIILLISALLHEAGHLVCIFLTRTKVCAVYFNIFGMKIVRGINPRLNYRDECKIALMGPCVNLLVFLLFLTMFFCLKSVILLQIALINAFMAMFNLLPIFCLDGGSALYSFLSMRKSSFTAHKAVRKVSFVFVVPLILFGVFQLFNTKYNFTFLLVGLYLIILLIFKNSKLSPC